MSQKLTGCLSRTDLEMVLNKRQFLASNLRRPKSAPMRRKQREIHVEDTATSRSGIEMSSEIKNGNTDTEPDTITQTQKGGAVFATTVSVRNGDVKEGAKHSDSDCRRRHCNTRCDGVQ